MFLTTAILLLVGVVGVVFFLWSPRFIAPEEWAASSPPHDDGDAG